MNNEWRYKYLDISEEMYRQLQIVISGAMYLSTAEIFS